MNLQESIRRILKEENFIPLESLNIVIEDYQYGFDLYIMNGDKKIGEISFAKESLPNVYTIVDATIDDEYKGNRIYPKTIINLFKERPNIIINSLFRSPGAQKAWIYLLSNLPSNIPKSVKYYKDEDTTLFQLKSRNLQESIRRILREEERKLPPFFTRRVDHHKFEKMMRKGIPYIFHDSNSLQEFKYKLVEATLENYIFYKYNINIDEIPQEDKDIFIQYMIEVYDPVLTTYYRNFYKR